MMKSKEGLCLTSAPLHPRSFTSAFDIPCSIFDVSFDRSRGTDTRIANDRFPFGRALHYNAGDNGA
jgi:hypothetical protein